MIQEKYEHTRTHVYIYICGSSPREIAAIQKTHTRTHTHTHTHTHTYIYIYIYMHIYMHTYIQTYVGVVPVKRLYKETHRRTYTHTRTQLYIYIYIYIYIFICRSSPREVAAVQRNPHTHIHAHTQTLIDRYTHRQIQRQFQIICIR